MCNLLTIMVQHRRRVLPVFCLLNAMLMTIGMPFYKTNGKDRSQPFLCMDSQCGCITAEQCWRYCCCHTMEEKLSWAREKGITPPQYVLNQASIAQNPEATCESDSCASCNLNKNQVCQCEKDNEQSAKNDCCSQPDTNKQHDFTWLATWKALKCLGHDGWNLLNSTIIVDPTQQEAVELTTVRGECDLPQAEALAFVPHLPATPPPRFVI